MLALASGLLLIWDAEDLAIEIGDHLCVWTDGSLEPYPSAGTSVAGAGVYLSAPEQGAIWQRLTNMVMLRWIRVVLLCRSLVLFRRFSDQSFGALSWPCSFLAVSLPGFWIMVLFPLPCSGKG